jgi:hypothetical protein
MSRRSTPERLDAARHAATRNRLIGEARMSEDRADEWLARWAAQASQEARERDAAYWDAAFEWIVGQQSWAISKRPVGSTS